MSDPGNVLSQLQRSEGMSTPLQVLRRSGTERGAAASECEAGSPETQVRLPGLIDLSVTKARTEQNVG